MEMIKQHEMLSEMLKRGPDGNFIPFSITWVTYNQKEKTGGEKITLNEAVFYGGPSKKDKPRNPNHFDNYTRNIRAYHGDRIMKVHVDLITRFNGKRITL
jgi:hypothetical protein